MNRSQLAPGGEYVDDLGDVYRIHDTEPGYSVQDGKWVEDPQTDRRYMGPVKGWQEYKANPNVRANLVGQLIDGEVKPVRGKPKAVIAPRRLVGTVEQVIKSRKQDNKTERQQERLGKTITSLMEGQGFKVLDVDADNRRVVLDMDSVVTALGA